ncbi:30S ribosomal protein S5P [Candidatus Haloredivivus sp. G17]|nr:30S ribosomal protein S5P [Candidatus Haloredivivus sp. G17]
MRPLKATDHGKTQAKTIQAFLSQWKEKSGSVTVELQPAPRGTGLACSDEVKKIMELAGIENVWVQTRGTTQTREDLIQAAGGGMGILLTVMILYRLYEQLAQKHMEELHPALKDFMQ